LTLTSAVTTILASISTKIKASFKKPNLAARKCRSLSKSTKRLKNNIKSFSVPHRPKINDLETRTAKETKNLSLGHSC
jgi:hypothetical protein